MFVRMVNSCLIINMKQISLFYAENVLKMRKMRKSANYADPHHRILSDALGKTVAIVTSDVMKMTTTYWATIGHLVHIIIVAATDKDL